MKAKIRRTRILGFAGIAIAVLVIWALVLGPRFAKPHALDLQKATAISQKTDLEKKVLELIASKNKIPETQKQIQALTTRFPEQANVPQLQSQITAVATSVGISGANIVSIAVDKPTLSTTGDTADMTIAINVIGSYNQLSQFINKLYTIPRAISVESITIANNSTPGNPTSSFVLNIGARTFLFHPIDPIPANLLK